MTDSNCVLKMPRCGLQAGNPVCVKCGLDPRATIYTSQQAGEEARSRALEAWQTADDKEQAAELSELEQRKAQAAKRQAEKERLEKEARKAEEAAQRLAKEKAEAAERNDRERKNAEAAPQRLAQEEAKAEASQRLAKAGKLKQTAMLVALFICAVGGYLAWEHQKAQAQVRAQAEQNPIQAELEKARNLAAKAEASQRAAEQLLPQKAKKLEQARLDSQRTAAKKESSVAASAIPSAAPSTCSDCPEMVVVPAGSFQMGSNDSEAGSDEKPVRSVNIKSFAIGKYEVTQGQWRAIMGSNPSKFTQCGDNCPVEQVSWNDIQTYVQKLNQNTGQRYRLPSEAEWEYTCRGGQQQKYCGSDNVGNVAWYGDNSSNTTHPVGKKAPNRYGLYDMSGNVWEWVQDRHSNSYEGAPTDGSAWEAGPVERVLRGGSWLFLARDTRVAFRGSYSPGTRDDNFGFRLARTLP